jgi:hypothetical protein
MWGCSSSPSVEAVIGGVAAQVARLLLERGLVLAKLFLGCGDQTEIMLRVLIIIFRRDGISGTLGVTGELEIFFGDMGRGAANFYILPVRLVHPRQRILVMSALAVIVTTAHALVLTVSHGLLFRQPLICGGADAAASLHRMSFKFRKFRRPGCEPLENASI